MPRQALRSTPHRAHNFFQQGRSSGGGLAAVAASPQRPSLPGFQPDLVAARSSMDLIAVDHEPALELLRGGPGRLDTLLTLDPFRERMPLTRKSGRLPRLAR